MSLYLWLILLAVAVPFILSFEKNLRYYKKWGFLFSAIFVTMIPFLVWDSYFVQKKYWGFNSDYLIGFNLYSLPIEEILFFMVVPYASLFAYYAIRFHFPRYKMKTTIGTWLTVVLLMLAVVMVVLNSDRLYTVINFSFFLLVLAVSYLAARDLLMSYYAIFPILLIPFGIMNGILTGTGIVEEVVWYNPDVFMGIRIGSIPLEDFFYAFSLVLMVLLLKEWFEKVWEKRR